jgi:hypothetical protein
MTDTLTGSYNRYTRLTECGVAALRKPGYTGFPEVMP